ncbi:MAG: hypothetical protein GF364_13510 [Candidatus Lokiarchaeota archaeon]|nr:hypothetical protein [Candidatus Lokiarchaeota archaeon]
MTVIRSIYHHLVRKLVDIVDWIEDSEEKAAIKDFVSEINTYIGKFAEFLPVDLEHSLSSHIELRQNLSQALDFHLKGVFSQVEELIHKKSFDLPDHVSYSDILKKLRQIYIQLKAIYDSIPDAGMQTFLDSSEELIQDLNTLRSFLDNCFEPMYNDEEQRVEGIEQHGTIIHYTRGEYQFLKHLVFVKTTLENEESHDSQVINRIARALNHLGKLILDHSLDFYYIKRTDRLYSVVNALPIHYFADIPSMNYLLEYFENAGMAAEPNTSYLNEIAASPYVFMQIQELLWLIFTHSEEMLGSKTLVYLDPYLMPPVIINSDVSLGEQAIWDNVRQKAEASLELLSVNRYIDQESGEKFVIDILDKIYSLVLEAKNKKRVAGLISCPLSYTSATLHVFDLLPPVLFSGFTFSHYLAKDKDIDKLKPFASKKGSYIGLLGKSKALKEKKSHLHTTYKGFIKALYSHNKKPETEIDAKEKALAAVKGSINLKHLKHRKDLKKQPDCEAQVPQPPTSCSRFDTYIRRMKQQPSRNTYSRTFSEFMEKFGHGKSEKEAVEYNQGTIGAIVFKNEKLQDLDDKEFHASIIELVKEWKSTQQDWENVKELDKDDPSKKSVKDKRAKLRTLLKRVVRKICGVTSKANYGDLYYLFIVDNELTPLDYYDYQKMINKLETCINDAGEVDTTILQKFRDFAGKKTSIRTLNKVFTSSTRIGKKTPNPNSRRTDQFKRSSRRIPTVMKDCDHLYHKFRAYFLRKRKIRHLGRQKGKLKNSIKSLNAEKGQLNAIKKKAVENQIEYEQFVLSKVENTLIPKNKRTLNKLADTIKNLQEDIKENIYNNLNTQPNTDIDTYFQNLADQLRRTCANQSLHHHNELVRFKNIMNMLLYDLDFQPTKKKSSQSQPQVPKKRNQKFILHLMVSDLQYFSHNYTQFEQYCDINHYTIPNVLQSANKTIAKKKLSDDLQRRLKYLAILQKLCVNRAINMMYQTIQYNIQGQRDEFLKELRKYSGKSPNEVIKKMRNKNTLKTINNKFKQFNLTSRERRLIFGRACHILQAGAMREQMLGFILDHLKNFATSTDPKQLEWSEKFLMQKTIPKKFAAEIRKNFLDSEYTRIKKTFIKKKGKQTWDREEGERKSDYIAELQKYYTETKNLSDTEATTKAERSWDNSGKYRLDNVCKKYRIRNIESPNWNTAQNIMRQARNIIFKIITHGCKKISKGVAVPKRQDRDILYERFAFTRLSKQAIDNLYKLGDTPARQRSRLISEYKVLNRKKGGGLKNPKGKDRASRLTDTQIDDLYKQIKQQYHVFLTPATAAAIDYLNYFTPRFTSNCISFETSDEAIIKISESGEEIENLKLPVSIDIQTGKKKSDWLDKSMQAISLKCSQFSSRMYHPLPIDRNKNKIYQINGGMNSVLKEFDQKKPQIIPKHQNKIILNAPHETKLTAPFKMKDNGVYSGNDLGYRTKNVQAFVKKKQDGRTYQVLGARYINECSSPFTSPRFEDPNDILQTKYGSLTIFPPQSTTQLGYLHTLLTSNTRDELLQAIKNLKLEDVIEHSQILDMSINQNQAGKTPSNDRNKTQLARRTGEQSRYGQLLAYIQSYIQTSTAQQFKIPDFIVNLYEEAVKTIGNKAQQAASMKAEALLNAIILKLAAAYIAELNQKPKIKSQYKLQYVRCKRFLKSMRNTAVITFPHLAERSKRSESAANIYARLDKKISAKIKDTSRYQGIYENIAKCSKKIVTRRSDHIAKSTASRVLINAETFNSSVDKFEKLGWTSHAAAGSGQSTKGFLFSQIEGRVKELYSIRKRRFKAVSAYKTSQESYADYLSGDEPTNSTAGFWIPVAGQPNTQKFVPVRWGNITRFKYNGQLRYAGRDLAAAIVLAIKGK